MAHSLSFYIGLGIASIVFSGFAAIGIGLLFQNEPADDRGQEGADTDPRLAECCREVLDTPAVDAPVQASLHDRGVTDA